MLSECQGAGLDHWLAARSADSRDDTSMAVRPPLGPLPSLRVTVFACTPKRTSIDDGRSMIACGDTEKVVALQV